MYVASLYARLVWRKEPLSHGTWYHLRVARPEKLPLCERRIQSRNAIGDALGGKRRVMKDQPRLGRLGVCIVAGQRRNAQLQAGSKVADAPVRHIGGQ